MMADSRLEVRSYEVTFMMEHATGDIVGELFHFFPDVAEEGITEPAYYYHDGESRNSCKVRGHDGSGSDGVGADVGRFEAYSVLAQKLCGGAKLGVNIRGRDGLEVSVDEDGVDGGVLIYSWVGQDWAYKCCP